MVCMIKKTLMCVWGGVCIASWSVAFIACRVLEGVSDCFFDIFMHISWNRMDRHKFKWKEGTFNIIST
jgi:hypothetical protein